MKADPRCTRPNTRLSRLLGPSPFSQGHVPAVLCATPVLLTSPRPVLAESSLRIRGVVEINLRDGRLYQSPDAPVEAGNASEHVNFRSEAG